MQHCDRADNRVLPRTISPTYLASYLFPLLLVAYEVYRVGYWMASHGIDFSEFGDGGWGFRLMLAVFAVQVVAEGVFLAAAWISRQSDLEQRFTTLSLGVFSSLLVLAFDFGLQIAF
jgi:hypothetical protein